MIYEYNARLTRVVDGDTVWLDVDLGFGVHANSDFLLYGINTLGAVVGVFLANFLLFQWLRIAAASRFATTSAPGRPVDGNSTR